MGGPARAPWFLGMSSVCVGAEDVKWGNAKVFARGKTGSEATWVGGISRRSPLPGNSQFEAENGNARCAAMAAIPADVAQNDSPAELSVRPVRRLLSKAW